MMPNRLSNPFLKAASGIRAWTTWWLVPRAVSRDEAFRESVLRSTIGIITILAMLSFAASVFIFQDEWRFLSFPTLHILGFVYCFSAAVFISNNRLVVAGWLLVLLALTGASGVVLLSRQNHSATGIFLGLPIYSMVPIVAALVLPRSQIILVSLLSVIAYSLSHFIIPVNDFAVEDLQAELMLAPVILLLVFEGVLLRQLRTEFDERLEEMGISIIETEQAKQQAEADRERAEDADRAKSQFLANVSHELRTPLNAIIGYDEIMLAGMVGDFTPQQNKLLGIIQHSSRRLLVLINDILDLSKIEARSFELYWAPMQPSKSLQAIVDDLRSIADEKDIYLEMVITETAPNTIISDKIRLEQILINLLSNAIKFTDEGGVRVTVRGTDDDAFMVEISDTGVGIPKEAQTYIFDPFRQVDGTLKRKHQGTGLGLSITKRLVEALGGSIRVRSEPGVGSTFTVILPCRKSSILNADRSDCT